MKLVRRKMIIMCCLLLFSGVLFIIYKTRSIEHKIRFDKYYLQQWYLQDKVDDMSIDHTMDESGFLAQRININSKINLGICDFWKNTYYKELTIAVIDSKVDIKHEDLSDHIWCNVHEIPDNEIDDDNNGYIDDINGWNFYSDSSNIHSGNKDAIHGTHCAGIIAADHNDIGIMGILGNTNVKLMVLPIFDDIDTKVDYQNLISAIEYAQKMGADICNISSVCVEGGGEIYRKMQKCDMIFVVAAGNFENSIISGLNLEKYSRYPACINLANVITVGSINEKVEYSSFSNYSSKFVDMCAPGEYIYSTLPNNKYGYESGTSMATPVVASVLGAYYYTTDGNMDEALELLYNFSEVNSEIEGYVCNGKVVHYKK